MIRARSSSKSRRAAQRRLQWQERRIVPDATLHEATKTANRYKRRKDVQRRATSSRESTRKQTFKQKQ